MKSQSTVVTGFALLLVFSAWASSASAPGQEFGTPIDGINRLLYVTDRAGLSIYDINNGHKFLRKLDVPDSGDYKGIAASPALGKLYLTSYKQDDLICVDLKPRTSTGASISAITLTAWP